MARKLDPNRGWMTRHAAGKILEVSDRRAETILKSAGVESRTIPFGSGRTQIEFRADGVRQYASALVQK